MRLKTYSPTFRNVLFTEKIEEKTAGGIYFPTKDTKLSIGGDLLVDTKVQFDGSETKLGDYIVVKTGKDCTETLIGDSILIMDGIRPTRVELEDGTYYQVMEQQVIGFNRT